MIVNTWLGWLVWLCLARTPPIQTDLVHWNINLQLQLKFIGTPISSAYKFYLLSILFVYRVRFVLAWIFNFQSVFFLALCFFNRNGTHFFVCVHLVSLHSVLCFNSKLDGSKLFLMKMYVNRSTNDISIHSNKNFY